MYRIYEVEITWKRKDSTTFKTVVTKNTEKSELAIALAMRDYCQPWEWQADPIDVKVNWVDKVSTYIPGAPH